MRIGLRVLSNPQWRGGINYIINWSAALGTLPKSERPEIILLPFDAAGERLAREWPVKVDGVTPFNAAAGLGLDFVYPATQIFEAPFGVPWAGWIPDWQCKHLPEMFSPLELARRDMHYKLLASAAPALALSSHMALHETRHLVPQSVPTHVLKFPALLSDADRAALKNAEAVREKYKVPDRYVIVCNQFWRHKNHQVVLEALARVRSPDMVCVMTGEMHDERWPLYIDELRALMQRPEIARHVVSLGSISRGEQLALMAQAVAIIQPSLFEGWSTVVEEARLLGVPSLLSRFPVHEEQNPPHSRFFDPFNAEELAHLLDGVWATPTNPERYVQAEAEQENFSRICAREFLALAHTAKQNYASEKNGPSTILAKQIARFSSIPQNNIETELQSRFYAGARAMFLTHPQELDKFMALCAQAGEAVHSRADKNIARVMKKQMAFEKAANALLSPEKVNFLRRAASWLKRLLGS